MRRGGLGHQGRQHGDTIEDAADHEEDAGRGVAKGDHHLAADDAEKRDGDIEREDDAAALIGGALVQPAFDDHRRAGGGKAGERAQDQPPGRIDHDAGQQRDDGDERSKDAEGAHMADALDDIRGEEAPEDEAGRPGRTDQTEDGGRVSLSSTANGKKQSLKTIAQKEKQGAEQEGSDREQVLSHHPSEIRSAVSKLGRCLVNCQPVSLYSALITVP
ncbi:hypothetical protein D9M68_481670 [compost metagenome]